MTVIVDGCSAGGDPGSLTTRLTRPNPSRSPLWAITLNAYVPDAVAVPVSSPLDRSPIPGGSEPEYTVNVTGVDAFSTRTVSRYALPRVAPRVAPSTRRSMPMDHPDAPMPLGFISPIVRSPALDPLKWEASRRRVIPVPVRTNASVVGALIAVANGSSRSW